ncbi:MAG: hypothetical protein GC159_00755 [Phycisphaera sp.]|nr:hypothetical protein [Phycisphaera sp.]
MSDIVPYEDKEEKTHDQAGDRAKRKSNHRDPGDDILTERQCLSMLSKLNGLVVLGQLSTAQANTIRGNLREILAHHRSRHAASTGPSVPDDLVTRLRDEPELLNMLAPFLTPDQIDSIKDD